MGIAEFVRYALPFTIAISASANAQSVTLPNPTDLKSAYCIGRLNGAKIKVDELPAQFRSQLEETQRQVDTSLQKLRAYLLPRLPFLDTSSVDLAVRSGEAARERTGGSWQRCMKPENEEIHLSCKADIEDVKSCRIPSFLPF
jgi:hypothetical protein